MAEAGTGPTGGGVADDRGTEKSGDAGFDWR